MPIPEGKTQISITLDDDLLELIDWFAEGAGLSRSKLIGNLVDVGLEEAMKPGVLGLTPRRMRQLVDFVESHPVLRKLFLSNETGEEMRRRGRKNTRKVMDKDSRSKSRKEGGK